MSCCGVFLVTASLAPKTKLIHDILFGFPQLARLAILDGDYVPSRTVGHPAFSRI
jgi:hypothetical protein